MAEKDKPKTLDDKLAELDPKSFPMQRDQQMIQGWRERVTYLTVLKDFIQHPATKLLIDAGRTEIISIKRKLENDPDLLLNPNRVGERAALIAEKKVHMFYLNLLNVHPENELADIEAAINLEFEPR